MTAATLALRAPAPLATVLAAASRRHGLAAQVWLGLPDKGTAAALADLQLPITVIDPRPEAQSACPAGARFVPSRAARGLADLRRQLPEGRLTVFGADCSDADVRDALLYVPRGLGVVVVALSPGASEGRVAALQDALQRWAPEHHVDVLVGEQGTAHLVAMAPPRTHVTFLIELYTHEYGNSGLSINLDNLVATLAATGRASHHVVHYDQRFHEGRPVTAADLAPPSTADVHVVVVTLHYHSHANPSVALLQQLRDRGSRVVLVWLDKKISRSTADYYAVADVNVVLDGNDFELPNAWPAFTPKNPRFFRDAGLPRDIDVSLVGEVRYLAQRKAMVERLRAETRVPVTLCGTSAADTKRVLSVAEYAALYQRSRISLAMTKDTVRQLKGRVFEIVHCGALLCCDVNHHVQAHFTPGRDYVEYHDYEHLVDRLQHYLRHEDERAAIAASGHRRATTYFSHDVFWRSLLSRCGASAIAWNREEER